MTHLSYAAKMRIFTTGTLLVIVGSFTLVSYHATQRLHALSPAPAGLYIYTDQASYAAGQVVGVTIANTTSKTVYLSNNCPEQPLFVYRQTAAGWIGIHAATDPGKCAGEPLEYTIPAGRSVPVDYSYWPGLFSKPGTYRLVANLESYSSGPSVTFTVK